MEYQVDLPVTPPSFNAVGHSGSRWTWTKTKKSWQADIEMSLIAASVPRGLERAEVRAVLTFPTRRRRDAGNYRTLLEKCTGDALVNGGWLADDTPDRFSFGAVEFRLGAAAQTTLIVTPGRWKGRDDATPTPPTASQPAAPPRRFRHRVKG